MEKPKSGLPDRESNLGIDCSHGLPLRNIAARFSRNKKQYYYSTRAWKNTQRDVRREMLLQQLQAPFFFTPRGEGVKRNTTRKNAGIFLESARKTTWAKPPHCRPTGSTFRLQSRFTTLLDGWWERSTVLNVGECEMRRGWSSGEMPKGVGGGGYPEKLPPYFPHAKVRVTPPLGIEPGSPEWEVCSLTEQPPRLPPIVSRLRVWENSSAFREFPARLRSFATAWDSSKSRRQLETRAPSTAVRPGLDVRVLRTAGGRSPGRATRRCFAGKVIHCVGGMPESLTALKANITSLRIYSVRRNERAKMGYPREKIPPISVIVWQDSHMRKSGSDPTGNRTQFA
ncbi:hypothetical protein PR048_024865 [Dryococelus australis]|uniref:Uncharacterized protein n=1 Tax=Dryococelus australis TaxID=614101 RepID=A0ABQ9GPS2_9NEOP|nr:hypothetical protein PR048_024865 [Dryococelus australis]